MKNKIKLLSISKDEHRSQYEFQKEQKLFGIIREILKKLNLENKFQDIESFARPTDEEGETIWDKEDNIKKYIDTIRTYNQETISVDIIFFSKKVALIFYYNKDKQQEISEVVGEFILEEE